ncbi:MAG: hypothetical protein GY774_16645 [Planctomycetes bacterium]|nr:hypothetical protein [Planctomycetota bacterium]
MSTAKIIKLNSKKSTKKTKTVAKKNPTSKQKAKRVKAVVSKKTVNTKASVITLNRKEIEETLKVSRDFLPKGYVVNTSLECIHIVTKGDKLAFETTDLEKAYTREIWYKGAEIDTCVKLLVLEGEIKALDPDIAKIELRFTKKKVSINDRCSIPTTSSDEFPKVITEVKGGTEITIKELPAKLKRVVKAAEEGELRSNASVFFDTKNARMVSNDGKRLHMDDIPSIKTDRHILLPVKSAELIAKHRDVEVVSVGKKKISLELAGGTMVSQLMEGKYLKYEEVIPVNNPVKVKFDGAEFLNLMKGVAPITTQDYQLVKLTVNGRLDVEMKNPEHGHYKWHMPCESEGKSRKDFVIGFNVKYLVDAVSAYKEPLIKMEMKDKNTACIINSKAVIMPMAL